MPTDHEPVSVPPGTGDTNDTTPAPPPPTPGNTAAWREGEGIAPDALLLVAPFPTTPPMRMPEEVWALTATAVDTHAVGEQMGEVTLFTGCWEPNQPPADLFALPPPQQHGPAPQL